MIFFPHAKINIGLAIIEKRRDGFHNIETVFFPVSLCDTLIVETVEENASQKLDFFCDGNDLPESCLYENLCCKAYQLLDADYHLPSTRIRLHKAIPIGAGLGGGSSDATYTLLALNDLYQLQMSDEKLTHYSRQVGSDCAFFLQKQPAFATSKGDALESVILSLSGYHIILIKPPVFVSTAYAYSLITPKKAQHYLPESLQASVSEWRYSVFNDFEEPLFSKFSEIAVIKEKLYGIGAVYASMSGSGSCVYGIFKESQKNIVDLFPGCFVWMQEL